MTPLLRVGKDGKIGLSTFSTANLDISGIADSDDIGLELRSGNLYGYPGRTQIALGANGTTNQRHVINSVHIDSTAHNSLDFLIWSPSAGTASTATLTVLSLMTVSSITQPSATLHVRPAGDANEASAELVVSNGASLGGGTIHCAQQVTPSSRKLKTDISYLSDEEKTAAYSNERALKHISFRYMKIQKGRFVRDKKSPLRRGLLYEETPASIRTPGESLSMDQRLLESEMAFQVLANRLESLEKEIPQ